MPDLDYDRIDAELDKLMTTLCLKAVALIIFDEATDTIGLHTSGMCIHTAQDCMAAMLEDEAESGDDACEANHGVN